MDGLLLRLISEKQLLHKLFWVTSSPRIWLDEPGHPWLLWAALIEICKDLTAPSHPKPWMGHPKLMLVRSVRNDFIQKLEKLKPLKWGATGILSIRRLAIRSSS